MKDWPWTARVLFWTTALMVIPILSAWADESYGTHGGRADHGQRSYLSGHRSQGLRGHFTGAGHYLRHLLKHQAAIGLSDEQVTRLKTIQLELDKTRIRTEAEIQIAERELSSLVEDEKTDLSAIEAKLKQTEALETALRMAAIKAKRDAMASLNPDQRKKDQIEHDKSMREHMGSARHHSEGPTSQGHSMKP